MEIVNMLAHQKIARRYQNFVARQRSEWNCGKMIKFVDIDKFNKIHDRHRSKGLETDNLKYMDIRSRMARGLLHFYTLGLDGSTPKRVLDLGSGVGYFPFICRVHGHEAQAIDASESRLYTEMIEFLEVPRHYHFIKAFQPLPAFASRFDIITSLQLQFHEYSDKSLWGAAEWEFFLNDAQTRIAHPNGQLYLIFNYYRGLGRYYPEPVERFFRKAGATIWRGCVHFKRLSIG